VFERAPFQACPHCKQDSTFGILSARGSILTRRCKSCRYSYAEPLPEIQKDVVYLDQFAISEIFKVKSGTRRLGASSQKFWEECERETNKTYLLQQVIFPASNIHFDETIVSPYSSDLMLAHEMMGGDRRFIHSEKVVLQQTIEFAKAFMRGLAAPKMQFHIDDILEGRRNEWIADLHISAKADFSVFAERVRRNREANASEYNHSSTAGKGSNPNFATF
jgi:hypothetical protein